MQLAEFRWRVAHTVEACWNNDDCLNLPLPTVAERVAKRPGPLPGQMRLQALVG